MWYGKGGISFIVIFISKAASMYGTVLLVSIVKKSVCAFLWCGSIVRV